MNNQSTFTIVAKTLFGLEDVLAKELKDLGAQEIHILKRAVMYTGNLELLYKSNYYLRTALKVLKSVAHFSAGNENEIYNKVKRIPWETFFSVHKTIAVDAVVYSDHFPHSKYIALKTKDAIVDRFRDISGERPSVNISNPDIKINIHISDRKCSISLDSSGTPLDKRGYKLEQTKAPMSEVLAAGILLLSNWNGATPLLNPMCGSGTLAIEAALIASNTPPGKWRSFCFEHWADFDENLWTSIKEKKQAQTQNMPVISASDIDRKAVEITRNNANRAGVSAFISIEHEDFLETQQPYNDCILILNPPYGERLQENKDIVQLYENIGSKLKHEYTGSEAWIISGNLPALKFIGLRPSKKMKLFNGPIECKLHKYELYRGSKKDKE